MEEIARLASKSTPSLPLRDFLALIGRQWKKILYWYG
jgi:hypothetical protein